MMHLNKHVGAIVIGGGFYGINIALYLAKEKNIDKVILIEREDRLMSRASYNNQARIHNGYHYPRSFTTAYRSRINSPNFLKDWPKSIKNNFTNIYAISKNNSKVTAKQFERFCYEIGANYEEADDDVKCLFNHRLIEKIYSVNEYAFDTRALYDWAVFELNKSKVEVLCSTSAKCIDKNRESTLTVTLENENIFSIDSNLVFNCTYSGLNQFGGGFPGIRNNLKHEIAEMALIQMPLSLSNLGVTVMDGPFFSMMPFPAKGVHSLSHVRYTPHMNWVDSKNINPYEKLDLYEKKTRVDRMFRDIQRYIPEIIKAEYKESMFEIKTILEKNEIDDGRPILFEDYPSLPGLYSVLGGKIDNIYDVFEMLEKIDLGGRH